MQPVQLSLLHISKTRFIAILKNSQYLVFMGIMLSFLSCAGTPDKITKHEDLSMPASMPVTSKSVELEPGDQIEIRFAYMPDFNEIQTIRPDGKVELLLVGEVVAAGKEPSQLRDELFKLYAKHFAHPDLAVFTRLAFKRKVYVGGSVLTPGALDMPGNLTALQAIMASGGFDQKTAEVKKVVVIRRKENGERQLFSLNFEKSLAGVESEPFPLAPMDIVYVPRTNMTEVAQWFSQLWEIIPVRFSTGYFWTTGSGL